MTSGEFKLRLGDWSYVLRQDPTSGELEVVSRALVGVVQKAVEYVKAEASAVVADVPLTVVEQRRSACRECESVKKVDLEANWYCKSCGCPEWERSRLQVKWEMPAAKCPLGKWPE